jgi:hypothetical protein
VNVSIILAIGGKGFYLIGLKYYRLAKLKIYGRELKKFILINPEQVNLAQRELAKLKKNSQFIKTSIDPHEKKKKVLKELRLKKRIEIEEMVKFKLEE